LQPCLLPCVTAAAAASNELLNESLQRRTHIDVGAMPACIIAATGTNG
jgi:hypothetical protein